MSVTKKPKLDKLLLKMHKDPVSALELLKKDHRRAERTHNEQMRDTLAFIAAFTLHIESDPKSKEKFLSHKFWDKSKKSASKGNISLLAARFVLGSKTAKGARYEQARTYGHAVDGLIEKKIEPREIPEYLAKQTVYGFIAQRPADSGTQGNNTDQNDENLDGQAATSLSITDHQSEGANKSADEDDDDNDYDEDDQTEKKASDRKPPADRQPRFRPDKHVMFDPGKYMERIMRAKPNESITLVLVRTDPGNKWLDFSATKVIEA